MGALRKNALRRRRLQQADTVAKAWVVHSRGTYLHGPRVAWKETIVNSKIDMIVPALGLWMIGNGMEVEAVEGVVMSRPSFLEHLLEVGKMVCGLRSGISAARYVPALAKEVIGKWKLANCPGRC